MRLPVPISVLFNAALLLGCTGVAAQGKVDAANEAVMPSVTAPAVRDPADQSYRIMISGMELFERGRASAPPVSSAGHGGLGKLRAGR